MFSIEENRLADSVKLNKGGSMRKLYLIFSMVLLPTLIFAGDVRVYTDSDLEKYNNLKGNTYSEPSYDRPQMEPQRKTEPKTVPSQTPEFNSVCREAIVKIRSGDMKNVNTLEVSIDTLRACYGSGQKRPSEFEELCRVVANRMSSVKLARTSGGL